MDQKKDPFKMAESANENLLIIFARTPMKGKVKTRLANSIGSSKALSVYKKLLSHTKEITAGCGADKCVAYSDDIVTNDLWDKKTFQKVMQQGNDLGERMHNAFIQGFSEKYKHVCLIGSDIFELTTDILNLAFDKLKTNDVVLGPATDGGYYLIGMNKPNEFLFQDISWSTSKVFGETTKKANALDLKFALLPELSDIDDIEDIKPGDREYLLS